MPHRRLPAPTAKAPRKQRASFRERYDDLELRRSKLIERLSRLSASTKGHPGYKRVQTLLNDSFRSSRVAQRLGVLQAAEWLIQILEKLTMTV